MKTFEQNRKNEWTEIVRATDLIGLPNGYKREWVLVGWANARLKKLHARELSRNQSILRFDVILQHDWPIEQCLLHIGVFFGGKTKKPCLHLFIHWLIECFHMTSRRPYWCPKTMKRRPCWCPKRVLWELNSFLMQTLSVIPINLHRFWPREWKHSIKQITNTYRNHFSRSYANRSKFRVNRAKITNGFVWTRQPVKFFRLSKIRPVMPCEGNLSHLTSRMTSAKKASAFFSLITFYWGNLLSDLYFLSSRLKWIAYE